MGCIASTHFVVLVNGEPSGFFRGSKGLRQGFPLSPLLSPLIVEGLSMLINKAKEDGETSGIKIARYLSITHLLFVDNVVLFGVGMIKEWFVYKNILYFFVRY